MKFYVEKHEQEYVVAQSVTDLTECCNTLEQEMKRGTIEWRLLSNHTIQAKASPVEWQIITNALEEQGISFGIRATDSIKRIRTYKDHGGCYLVRYSHPLQDTRAKLQLTMRSSEKPAHTETEVIEGLNKAGIQVDTGVLLQKVQPEERGGARYIYAYAFEIDTQTDIKSYAIARELTEQAQTIRIGGEDYYVQWEGRAYKEFLPYKAPHKPNAPEPQAVQLMDAQKARDPRAHPGTELVTVRWPIVTHLKHRNPRIQVEAGEVTREVMVPPPHSLSTNRATPDYIPLGIKFKKRQYCKKDEGVTIYAVHHIDRWPPRLDAPTDTDLMRGYEGWHRLDDRHSIGLEIAKLAPKADPTKTWKLYEVRADEITKAKNTI